jgi:hypothetical protein
VLSGFKDKRKSHAISVRRSSRVDAKTQRKTRNLKITSCKSFNPGYPDMACATLRYQTK